jgi:hypothetical protein
MTMTEAVLVGLLALAVSALGGWPLTAAVLRWAARSRDAGTDPSPARPEDLTTDDDAPAAADAAGTPSGTTSTDTTSADTTSTDTTSTGTTSADTASGVAASVGATPGGAPPTPPAVPDGSLLRGGTWIGLLERIAVTGTLALGYPEGIAFVVAVKGLGRYPELREHPGLSERFVIGTFASLAWAAAVGAAARALLV